MQDLYRHKGMRKKLIEEIRSKGIHNEDVLSAMNNLPRHFFLDSSFLEFAYEDKPFPIGSGQTISQPYTVAFQTQLLEVKRGDKVLEVGTGSGYQACVLDLMGAKVFTIERQKRLFDKTKELLRTMKTMVKVFYGDGFAGLPTYGPFDKILITAAAPHIPQALIDQLRPGGMIVVPLGEGDVQTMIRYIKHQDGQLTAEEFGTFRFVPMLKDKAND